MRTLHALLCLLSITSPATPILLEASPRGMNGSWTPPSGFPMSPHPVIGASSRSRLTVCQPTGPQEHATHAMTSVLSEHMQSWHLGLGHHAVVASCSGLPLTQLWHHARGCKDCASYTLRGTACGRAYASPAVPSWGAVPCHARIRRVQPSHHHHTTTMAPCRASSW